MTLVPVFMPAWLPAPGTPTMLPFGYCSLARMMTLMPWNRSVPPDAVLLRQPSTRT